MSCQTCPVSCTTCSSLSQCTTCQAGLVLHRGGCLASCPNGFYQPSSSATCQPCPGTCATCNQVGTGIECSSCRQPYHLYAFTCSRTCPAGFFTQNQVCTPCQAGTYTSAASDATSCVACSPGRYQLSAGQRQCDVCEPGFVQASSGKATCELCPTQAYQPSSGQASCITCTAGYTVSNDRSACRGMLVSCFRGSYSHLLCQIQRPQTFPSNLRCRSTTSAMPSLCPLLRRRTMLLTGYWTFNQRIAS